MPSVAYKNSGVDTEKTDEFVEDLKHTVKSTYNINVAEGVGGFASCYRLPVEDYDEPMLVSSTDGVGTKLRIAQKYHKHYGIGLDLVAMCVNDLITVGAKPLYFLDYLAAGKLQPDVAMQIMRGIVAGCKKAECALVGGETAEMPGLYNKNEYDVAGFCTGVVDNGKIIDGSV